MNWKYLDNTRMSSQFLKLCRYCDMLVCRWTDSSSRRVSSPLTTDSVSRSFGKARSAAGDAT
jgi:hypothetical protein